MSEQSPSVWFGLLTQDQKEEVLKNVGKEAAATFKTYKDTIHKSVGLRTPMASARLDAYRKRHPNDWTQLSQQFPQTYNKQMVDWGKLEQAESKKQAARIEKPELGSIGVQAGYGAPMPSMPELG